MSNKVGSGEVARVSPPAIQPSSQLWNLSPPITTACNNHSLRCHLVSHHPATPALRYKTSRTTPPSSPALATTATAPVGGAPRSTDPSQS